MLRASRFNTIDFVISINFTAFIGHFQCPNRSLDVLYIFSWFDLDLMNIFSAVRYKRLSKPWKFSLRRLINVKRQFGSKYGLQNRAFLFIFQDFIFQVSETLSWRLGLSLTALYMLRSHRNIGQIWVNAFKSSRVGILCLIFYFLLFADLSVFFELFSV